MPDTVVTVTHTFKNTTPEQHKKWAQIAEAAADRGWTAMGAELCLIGAGVPMSEVTKPEVHVKHEHK